MPQPLTRKQLYDLVWKKPMTVAAKEYGLSDRGLAKLCERNDIPVPPRGYWARKAAKQKVYKPRLIMNKALEGDIVLSPKQKPPVQNNIEKAETDTIPMEVQEAISRETLPKNRITVPKTLHNPHLIITRWIMEDDKSWEYWRQYNTEEKSPRTPIKQRKWRIFSALLKALETRGFKVEVGQAYRRDVCVEKDGYKVRVGIEEYIRQRRRELTKQEKISNSWGQKYTVEKENTGLLVVKLSEPDYRCLLRKIQEDGVQPLENRLNDVVLEIIKELWEHKKHHLAREESRRRWEQEEQRQRRIKEALAVEKRRTDSLETKAHDWKKAMEIREYIVAVETAFSCGALKAEEEIAKWKTWALAHADALDPITKKEPLA